MVIFVALLEAYYYQSAEVLLLKFAFMSNIKDHLCEVQKYYKFHEKENSFWQTPRVQVLVYVS